MEVLRTEFKIVDLILRKCQFFHHQKNRTCGKYLYLFVATICFFLCTQGACFDTPSPDCAFACGAEAEACPDGFSCRSDGLCKRNDLADDYECETLAPPSVTSQTQTQATNE